MGDQTAQHLCLEESCKGHQAMKWTPFVKHQRKEHLKEWCVHWKWFSSTIEFQVWFEFVRKHYLHLNSVKYSGTSFYASCNAATSTVCPARLFTKKTKKGQKWILAVYMGGHYGHDNNLDHESRLFLLEYGYLAVCPFNEWLMYFKHAGVFLLTQSSRKLVKKTAELASKSKTLDVLGIMNQQQLRILKRFHLVICLENYGNWIALYSLVTPTRDSRSCLALPVTYCFCNNLMDQTIVREFFLAVRERTGPLSCCLVLCNDEHLFEEPWEDVFPESRPVFMQSWQDVVAKIIDFLPETLNYREAIEIGKLLKVSICEKYPNYRHILKKFLAAAELSEILHADTIISLQVGQHQKRLQELVEEWISDVSAEGWTNSYRCRMFLCDQYYMNKGIMNEMILPSAVMQLTLYSRHVINTSPPLENLDDCYCAIEF